MAHPPIEVLDAPFKLECRRASERGGEGGGHKYKPEKIIITIKTLSLPHIYKNSRLSII
jgi:hypothetical protein